LAGSFLNVRRRSAPVAGTHGVDDAQRSGQRKLHESEQEYRKSGAAGRDNHRD
jgi:hypothetical protein